MENDEAPKQPPARMQLAEIPGPPPDALPIKLGDPTRYDPTTMPAKVLELGGFGKSRAQIARQLGISRRRLDEWEKTHAIFKEALEVADTLALAWWEDQGQLGIFLSAKEFNMSAWLAQIRARFPEIYREVTAHEHTGKNGGPIETQNVGTETERRLMDALNTALGRVRARAEAQTIEARVINGNGVTKTYRN